jgi:hypothetical protein
MVVNTGRAASRAIYLNLANQPDIYAFPRYAFDTVTTAYISQGDRDPLARLSRQVRRESSRQFGFTFHGARPRLAYPFDAEINKRYLTDVRDLLGVERIFLIVRQPKGLLRSELNRSIASFLGNWRFENEGTNWCEELSLKTLLAIADASAFKPKGGRRNVPKFNLDNLVRNLSMRTGKPYAMYLLFKCVFPTVHLISYEAFVRNPVDVFNRMGQIAGFRFENASLANVKLNGLANRFLCYNTIDVARADAQTWKFWSRLSNRLAARPGKNLRLRLEISEVIEKCEDWGRYVSLNSDLSILLPSVVDDLRVPVGLGIRVTDSDGTYAEVDCPASLCDAISRPLAALFEHNYRRTRALYRGAYLDKIYHSHYDIFLSQNRDQYEPVESLMRLEPAEFQFRPSSA